MHSSNNEAKKPSQGEQRAQAEPELSEAWRALLGLPSAAEDHGELDTVNQVQPLTSDPWNHLLHSQGMQPVDLQKTHLRELARGQDDRDVEHALNVMREATGQLLPLDEKPGEA
jgi:hypothetical protein